jgi:cobalt/nickel transport system permease protein
MKLLEPYQERESVVHRLDPRVKVVLAFAFILSMALLPDGAWAAMLLGLAPVLAITLLGRLSPWMVARRAMIALPFLLAAATVLFLPGNPLWVGPWGVAISDAGLVRFLSILGRSILSLSMAILLTATTPFPDILHALRHLRLPATLLSIIAFMYRYLFILVEEVMRLLRARTARSALRPGHKGGGTPVWQATVAGHMAGQLFVRSLDRSERVYQAMLARGYRGEFLTFNPHQMRPVDWAVLFGFGIFLLIPHLLVRS